MRGLVPASMQLAGLVWHRRMLLQLIPSTVNINGGDLEGLLRLAPPYMH